MDPKKWFLIIGGLSVIIIAAVLTAVICMSSKQTPPTDPNPTDEPTNADTTEEATPQTTETSEPEPEEPETTAPPVTDPVTDPVSVPDPPPRPLPPPGDHKSANFGNVLFIGDSRTVGLMDYANLGCADVFAENGLNVFRLFKDAVTVPGRGKVTLNSMLSGKQYDKIYIMLGINEIGYDLDRVINFYGKALDTIQTCQPGATIYIQANLMIQKSRSDRDNVYNNNNMRYLNEHMAAFADGVKRIYVDVNPLFGDGAGNLDPQYAHDDFHLIGSWYAVWADWLYENTCE